MKRHRIEARSNWREQADVFGYDYHQFGPNETDAAWRETACYSFTADEVERLHAATQTLHGMCLQMVDHVVWHPELMARFGIPAHLTQLVRGSWLHQHHNPHFLGRFDLAFAPETGAVKMLEYNADTPTTTIETAVMQWQWLQATAPERDQFNSLHEELIERFRSLAAAGRLRSSRLHLAPCPDSLEDYRHCEYYAELAAQAGLEAQLIEFKDIGLRHEDGRFVDNDDQVIEVLMKTYPWEMLAKDRFSHALPASGMQTLEPAWKLLLSNKAILPTLWEMFPDCPYLLRAQWTPDGMTDFVSKPIFSREGQNITVVRDGGIAAATEGTYGDYPLVYQDYVDLPVMDGCRPVIGSWVVGDTPAGILVREGLSDGIIVDRSACVPHFIEG